MKTLQDMFNAAYIGVMTQGGPAMMPVRYQGDKTWPGCAYRGSNGRKCALGHNIDDAHYVEGIENAGPNSVAAGPDGRWVAKSVDIPLNAACLADAMNSSGIPADEHTRTFLQRLQRAHDSAAGDNFAGGDDDGFIAEFELLIQRLAEEYGLDMPEMP